MLNQKVLILSASTGTGHRRAGEAVREAILETDPEASVRHVDLLTLAPQWVRTAYGGGYEFVASRVPWLWDRVYHHTDGDGSDHPRWSALAAKLLFREFRKLLDSDAWDVCFCTHFLPCQLAAGQRGLPPLAIAITDFTLHRYWVQPSVQHYFCPTDEVAAELLRRKPRATVEATGIPISTRFGRAPSRLEARAKLDLPVRRQVVVVMGGGLGLGIASMVLATLEGAPAGTQVVAICGRNDEAASTLASLGLPAERLRVERFIDDVESFLAAADLVVTKPGGLTVSEALAVGRPLLLTQAIPGQEVGNTRAIVSAGAALAAADGREIAAAVQRLATDDVLLSGLAAAARRAGRQAAAKDVSRSIGERYRPSRRLATIDGGRAGVTSLAG